jgi:glycosyltransferase involved in cell wall biosynthesis
MNTWTQVDRSRLPDHVPSNSVSAKKRILLIMSRDYGNAPPSGRTVIINNYLWALKEHADIEVVAARSVLESRSLILWAEFAFKALLYFIGIYRRPIQVALYDNVQNKSLIARLLKQQPDVVFVDTIRLAFVVGRQAVKCQLIMDMDDLMSRRYSHYLESGGELEFGLLGARLAGIGKFLPERATQWLLRREVQRLKTEEAWAAGHFDKIVFTSSVEMRRFGDMVSKRRARLFAQSFIVKQRQTRAGTYQGAPLRFGFIGTDKVPQNRLTIQWLLWVWEKHDIAHKLVIAGQQKQLYKPQDNCEFLGFVPDLGEFYANVDALVAPSFVKGGVKMKVLEAVGFECPVIGNRVTFEGIDFPRDYHLRFRSEEALLSFLQGDPEKISSELNRARDALSEVRHRYSVEKYQRFAQDLFGV